MTSLSAASHRLIYCGSGWADRTHDHVSCDEDFDTDRRPARCLPLGASVAVAHLAARLREAATLRTRPTLSPSRPPRTTKSSPRSGTSCTPQPTELGAAADPYTAARLRHLSHEYLRVLRTDLSHTRTQAPGR
ncbi:hypothetical protein OG381_01390 [Streptomyces sp. NBC_00490]|uniref:hypothetical protein n=1 Tax=Streptomyces sp. NBC_00490 TaxID=2903657 RepID=UPI002E174159